MRDVRVDWNEYYRRFSETHGGEPILYGVDEDSGKGGMLLFRDGWMYGKTPMGPEVPPASPEDALRKSLTYWRKRENIYREELKMLSHQVQSIVDTQRGVSADLPVVCTINGKQEEMDVSTLVDSIHNIQEEVRYCIEQRNRVKMEGVEQVSRKSILPQALEAVQTSFKLLERNGEDT